jgi:hypothetical protein
VLLALGHPPSDAFLRSYLAAADLLLDSFGAAALVQLLALVSTATRAPPPKQLATAVLKQLEGGWGARFGGCSCRQPAAPRHPSPPPHALAHSTSP